MNLSNRQWIGQRMPRKEDDRLTAGRGHYLADLKLPNMLHAVFVRSQHAHARILNIDAEAAKASRGVVAVVTGEDIRNAILPFPSAVVVPNLPARFPTHWPLAVGKAKYHGEPLAVVVATDKYLAEDAAELVEVDYEPLLYVGSPEAAMRPGAPRVHEDWPDNEMFSMSFTGGATEDSVDQNVAELDAIMAAAPVVVTEQFKTHRTGVTPLETRGVVATWDPDDGLTCWITTQRPHIDRLAIAELLQLPTHKVRVIAPRDIGGGFGIKAPFYREHVLIPHLARQLNRPVRWVESREESLMVVGQERDQTHELSLAADEKGRILGLRARIIADTGDGCQGVYWGFVMPFLGAVLLPSGYLIPKADVQLRCYVTNKPCISPSRSFGSFPGRFALERMMDLLAKRVGRDPVAIRVLNVVREFPHTPITGGHLDSGDFVQVIESVARTVGFSQFRDEQRRARNQGRYIGIGFGTGAECSGTTSEDFIQLENQPGYGVATVQVDPRGRVQVLEGDAPTGTGHETAFAQIVAQELGLSPEDVIVRTGDTAHTPFSSGQIGARAGSNTFGAVANATRKIRDKMARIFLHDLGSDAELQDVVFADGRVFLKDSLGTTRGFSELADRIIMKSINLPEGEQGELQATAHFEPPKAIVAYSAHACIVEVDVSTGAIKILRYVACEDAGTIINPLIVEGQVQGGVVQGISNAMFEEFLFDEHGQQLTNTFESYKMAIAPDVPHIEVTHEGSPCPSTPLGSRGLGEGTPGPVPGALVNAVCDALAPFGVEINELPLRPTKIWEQLRHVDERSGPGEPAKVDTVPGA